MPAPRPAPASAAPPRSVRLSQLCLALCLALALALVPQGAEAAFKVEKATFKVNMPSKIAGSYDMAIANFGTPLYGAILT
jgi:hypothetical protein